MFARVPKALQEKLLRQDLFEEFCHEFTREMNRSGWHRASLSAAEREIERVPNDLHRVLEAIKNGFAGPDLKAEWDAPQERNTALQTQLEPADEPPLKPFGVSSTPSSSPCGRLPAEAGSDARQSGGGHGGLNPRRAEAASWGAHDSIPVQRPRDRS